MERDIRATKRELIATDSARNVSGIDPALKEQLGQDYTAASLKLERQKETLADFLGQTGRAEDRARVMVDGFDRSHAQTSVWSARKSGLTNAADGGKINKAKASDLFKYERVPENAVITPQSIVDELKTSPIGRETLEYIESSGVLPKLVYEPQHHTNRGDQLYSDIRIFISNIQNDRVAACTVIHEMTHHRYGIERCQWAEAVCMAKEKMHLVGRNRLTYAEKKYIVSLATRAYPEFEWKRGGYKHGRRADR